MNRKLIFVFIIILQLLILSSISFPESKNRGKKGKAIITGTKYNPSQTLIDINNISAWINEAGLHDWIIASSWNGAYPIGNNAGGIFTEGIIWGGKVYDGKLPLVRVNGNTYNSGCRAITRIFRVRPDYKTTDLTSDYASYYLTSLENARKQGTRALYEQYEKDRMEWPANMGAPWYVDNVGELRNDNQYDPNNPHHIPGMPNASQTIFVMYNDSNSTTLYGSPPIGLQISETYWAYSLPGALGNTIFKKVDIIYKGTDSSAADSKIDSMYVVQWADPDLGSGGDDLVGCDTSLNLGFVYNSGIYDSKYKELYLHTPAIGYDILQGASRYTGNPNDSAMFNLEWRKGYKYVNPKPMSSFIYYTARGLWNDPELSGNDTNYSGTLQFYNLMRGKLPLPSYPSAETFPAEITDNTPFGTYLCDGDPVSGKGKIDGFIDKAGDRRMMLVNGPFTINLGDTVQIVAAEIGAITNEDYNESISSLKQLKYNTGFINSFVKNRIAACIHLPVYANVDSTTIISAEIFPSSKNINSTNWSVTKKPEGSQITLQVIQNTSASFKADKAGDYEITFSAEVNGKVISDIRNTKLINNRKPVAVMNLNKTQLMWGDSVFIDYSGSYDEDGDSLRYVFTGDAFMRNNEKERTGYLLPYKSILGNASVSMKVFDKYSYDSTEVSFEVKPILKNITLDYSFIDSAWLNNNIENPMIGDFYFYGDNELYVPMQKSLRHYEVKDNTIELREDNPNIKVDKIWFIKDNLLFGEVDQSKKLSIFDLSNNNEILTKYLPGLNDISRLIKIDSTIFIQDVNYDSDVSSQNNLYKMDFSNPSFPKIIKTLNLPGPSYFLWNDDKYLYYSITPYYSSSRYIAMISISELDLTTSRNTTFLLDKEKYAFHDSLLICSKYWNDTLFIYKLSGEDEYKFLRTVLESNLFPDPYPSNSMNFFYGFVGDLFYLIDHESLRIFDISDINDIKTIGTWYGGGGHNQELIPHNKGKYYYIIKNYYGGIDLKNPYSGINKVTFNLRYNYIENTILTSYVLKQNYPNPFNPNTTIEYSIPKTSHVVINIYNILGEKVKTLVNEIKSPGQYKFIFDGEQFASGVYFYRLQAGNYGETKKLILLR